MAETLCVNRGSGLAPDFAAADVRAPMIVLERTSKSTGTRDRGAAAPPPRCPRRPPCGAVCAALRLEPARSRIPPPAGRVRLHGAADGEQSQLHRVAAGAGAHQDVKGVPPVPHQVVPGPEVMVAGDRRRAPLLLWPRLPHPKRSEGGVLAGLSFPLLGDKPRE